MFGSPTQRLIILYVLMIPVNLPITPRAEVILSPASLQAFALNSHFQAGLPFQQVWAICLSVAIF